MVIKYENNHRKEKGTDLNKIKEDLLFHPVRIRIILATAGRQVTAQQLAGELPDIPQATLYRNINTLAAAGFLSVVKERRVHNTIEKTYSLPEQGLFFTKDDFQNAGTEDLIRIFTRFLGLQLGYYVRYIEHGEVDFSKDPVLFELTPLNLNPAEVKEFTKSLGDLLRSYLKNEPAQDRQRIVLGLTSIPDVKGVPLPKSYLTGEGSIGTRAARQEEENEEYGN